MRERLRPWGPVIYFVAFTVALLSLMLAAVFGVRWAPNALIGLGFVLMCSSLSPGWWKPLPKPRVMARDMDELRRQLEEIRRSELDEHVEDGLRRPLGE